MGTALETNDSNRVLERSLMKPFPLRHTFESRGQQCLDSLLSIWKSHQQSNRSHKKLRINRLFIIHAIIASQVPVQASAIDYEPARSKVIEAAYIQTGGKALTDNLTLYAQHQAKKIVVDAGVPEGLVRKASGAVVGGYTIYKNKEIKLPIDNKTLTVKQDQIQMEVKFALPVL